MVSHSYINACVINMASNVFITVVFCRSVYFIFILSEIILRILGIVEKTRVEAHVY